MIHSPVCVMEWRELLEFQRMEAVYHVIELKGFPKFPNPPPPPFRVPIKIKIIVL